MDTSDSDRETARLQRVGCWLAHEHGAPTTNFLVEKPFSSLPRKASCEIRVEPAFEGDD